MSRSAERLYARRNIVERYIKKLKCCQKKEKAEHFIVPQISSTEVEHREVMKNKPCIVQERLT